MKVLLSSIGYALVLIGYAFILTLYVFIQTFLLLKNWRRHLARGLRQLADWLDGSVKVKPVAKRRPRPCLTVEQPQRPAWLTSSVQPAAAAFKPAAVVPESPVVVLEDAAAPEAAPGSPVVALEPAAVAPESPVVEFGSPAVAPEVAFEPLAVAFGPAAAVLESPAVALEGAAAPEAAPESSVVAPEPAAVAPESPGVEFEPLAAESEPLVPNVVLATSLDLSSLTVRQLRQLARERGIPSYSRVSKQRLVELLSVM